MKLCAAVLSTFAIALTVSGVSGGVTNVAQADAAKEDGSFWDRYLQDADSFTPPPTEPPVVPPTPPPTEPPVVPPTPPPVPGPTPPPTPPPTLSPTAGCDLTLTFECIESETGNSCETIPSEDQLICSCPDCVRELVFSYTGAGCNGNEASCTDFFDAPHPESARITICASSDATTCPFDETISIGDTITLSDDNCLPDNMAASVASVDGLLLQTVELVTSCQILDGGLILKEEYGAFQSEGYSCDDDDVHNCLLQILYEVEACNVGGRDEQVFEFFIDEDGVIYSFIDEIDDLMLAPDECIDAAKESFIDVCSDNTYTTVAVVNLTNPATGPVCEETDEITFNFTASTLPPIPPTTPPPVVPPPTPPPVVPPTPPPTPPPVVPPTPPPTPPPVVPPTPDTSSPTTAPSPAPTNTCLIDVEIDGCFNFTPPFDNNCQGRLTIIEFRYNGGDCSQSDNLQDRQKFDCFDVPPPVGLGPPPTTAGTTSYIVATSLGGTDVYFEGFVDVGDSYIINENLIFDRIAADMNITAYDPAGSDDPATIVARSNMLQTLFIHLSCSQPLFLLDRFGAQQVVEWVEASGRVVTTQVETTTEPLTLSLNSNNIVGQDGVRLLEMNIISNTEGFINKTDEVNGVVITEGDTIELSPINVTLDLSQRTRYTFFTTIRGETLDGTAECNGFDFHECIVGVALPPAFPTLAPTPSPTTTPFPTPDPFETECSAEAVINCVVTEPFNDAGCQAIPPLTPTCTAGAILAFLNFNFTGLKCDGTPGCVDLSDDAIPEEVYIEIKDCETTAFFQASANIGDSIKVNSRGTFLCDTFEVSIQTLNFNEEEERNEGVPLQNISLPTSCLDGDSAWTINENYGALRLTQYRSDINGIQAEFVTVLMSYVVANPGAFGANIDSAFLSSAFSGESELLTSTTLVPARSQSQISSETVSVDMLGEAGSTFEFSLSITGASDTEAASVCASDTTFSFSV